jgi:hypothetical protein
MHVVFQPANALDLPYIELRHVGFDIQQGSSVYNINILNMENPRFNPDKTHHRKPYRVWPAWPPDRKDPVLTVIHKRLNSEGCPLGQMKVVNQYNVRKPLDILEAFYILRKHLHCSSHASGACRLYWGSLGRFERRAYNPNRPIRDLIHSSIRPVGSLLHQIHATTGECARISCSMAPTFFSRCARIPAFFYHLEFKPTLLANINLSLFHFMTISHLIMPLAPHTLWWYC